MKEELLKNLISERVKRQQVVQTQRRIYSGVLGVLESRLLSGDISEKEYREKKAQYIDTLFELYMKDIISFEELQRKMNA